MTDTSKKMLVSIAVGCKDWEQHKKNRSRVQFLQLAKQVSWALLQSHSAATGANTSQRTISHGMMSEGGAAGKKASKTMTGMCCANCWTVERTTNVGAYMQYCTQPNPMHVAYS